eukprot:59194-Lingulodinium_polyedra.AAC.1
MLQIRSIRLHPWLVNGLTNSCARTHFYEPSYAVCVRPVDGTATGCEADEYKIIDHTSHRGIRSIVSFYSRV